MEILYRKGAMLVFSTDNIKDWRIHTGFKKGIGTKNRKVHKELMPLACRDTLDRIKNSFVATETAAYMVDLATKTYCLY